MKWILTWAGAILAGFGVFLSVDLMLKPRAVEYAAGLFPGGIYFYPVIAVAGLILLIVGYRMK